MPPQSRKDRQEQAAVQADQQEQAHKDEILGAVQAAEEEQARATNREQASADPDAYIAARTPSVGHDVRSGADPTKAAPTTAVARVGGASGQAAQEATTGVGLYTDPHGGEKLDVASLQGDAKVSTVRMTDNVYEEFVLPSSDPNDPRVARRLVFRKGQDVPLSRLEGIKRRFAPTESKEGRSTAPENKGPGAVEQK